MADINLTYKIIILGLLDKAKMPLSNTTIVDFFLEYEYTDYFSAQMALSDIVDSKMVDTIETHGNTSYTINEEGSKTLELFSDKINDDIEKDIVSYYKDNKLKMREEQEIIADYTELSTGGYMVNCKIRDVKRNRSSYEVNCIVSSKEQAEAICNNWHAKYEDIYFAFLEELTR